MSAILCLRNLATYSLLNEEKVYCQLGHPFSAVTVYIAKLENLIRAFFSVFLMFSQNI